MSEHLTNKERRTLYHADESCGCGGVGDLVIAVIERILTDRLAATKPPRECCSLDGPKCEEHRP